MTPTNKKPATMPPPIHHFLRRDPHRLDATACETIQYDIMCSYLVHASAAFVKALRGQT